MFLQSGGNFDLVELNVKQWVESKKTSTDLESRVTKRQLREKYFWDEAGVLLNKFLVTHIHTYMFAWICTYIYLYNYIDYNLCNELRMFVCIDYTTACVLGCLQEMIENTFKWAKENNKLFKHPISGGEFVDIDVEHLKKNVNEKGSRFSQAATAHYEAWFVCVHMRFCDHT